MSHTESTCHVLCRRPHIIYTPIRVLPLLLRTADVFVKMLFDRNHRGYAKLYFSIKKKRLLQYTCMAVYIIWCSYIIYSSFSSVLRASTINVCDCSAIGTSNFTNYDYLSRLLMANKVHIADELLEQRINIWICKRITTRSFENVKSKHYSPLSTEW